MYDVRIFFEKVGRAKYISHLDLYRCFIRCLKRSDINIWYTQGFNQHMYLTFALPLSLGVEGKYEVLDLRFEEEIDFDVARDKINNVLPVGIRVIKIALPVSKPSMISTAKYHVDVVTERPKEVSAAFEQFLKMEKIEVEKKSKRKGIVMLDIRPFFNEITPTQRQDGQIAFDILLPTGGTLNINPQLLVDAFSASCADVNFVVQISRMEIYDDQGNVFE